MVNIEQSYLIKGDLISAIGLLSARLDLNNSQLVDNILRKDPEISAIIKELERVGEIPDYVPEKSTKIITPLSASDT